MPILKRFIAELFGTFWLVLGGCGSGVLAAGFPQIGIGFVGVSLAFGLTVLTMAYSIGHIAGCHRNPAVTIGLWAGKRLPAKDIAPFAGAIIAAAVLYFIASGKAEFALGLHSLAFNGYDSQSLDGYNLTSALITEIVLTFGFLVVILGATDMRTTSGFAPLRRLLSA